MKTLNKYNGLETHLDSSGRINNSHRLTVNVTVTIHDNPKVNTIQASQVDISINQTDRST